MPRYYFHVRRGQVRILDREGTELADIDEAAKEAARRARQIAARESLNGVRLSPGIIVVEDDWQTVLELPLDDLMLSCLV
jgi:hypothetical protein